MRTISFLSIFFICWMPVAQNITIPDANFKKALLNYTYTDTNQNTIKLDANSDGEIQVSEANSFQWVLNISSQGISDLTGLEAFINIKELHCGGSNTFTTLDLSKNVALEIVYARNTGKIEHIDITKCTKLEELYCDGNNLDDLDITKNTVLKTLDCSSNQMTKIDFSANVLLDQITMNDIKLTALNTDALVNLTGLYCNNVSFGTSTLPTLSFSKNLKLKNLELKGVQVKNLDISKNIDLVLLNVGNNELTGLDLSKHDDLMHVYVHNNKLTSLNVANGFNNNPNANFKLQTLWTNGNPNLKFICVDDLNYAAAQLLKTGQTDSWTKDPTTSYTTNCTLSQKEYDLELSVQLYPNPVKHTLQIQLQSHINIASIRVSNIQGKVLMNTIKEKLYVAALPRGMYFLQLIDEKGNSTTRKFIKE